MKYLPSEYCTQNAWVITGCNMPSQFINMDGFNRFQNHPEHRTKLNGFSGLQPLNRAVLKSSFLIWSGLLWVSEIEVLSANWLSSESLLLQIDALSISGLT